MGISSNQARFLALTSRQVDLENRVQQICQRRLRLSSELEKVATDYNNNIGNRQLYTYNTSNSGISQLSLTGANAISTLKDTNGNSYQAVAQNSADSNKYTTGLAWSSGTGFTVTTNGTAGTSITLANLGLPTTASESVALDAAIRSGLITIVSVADTYTQSPTSVGTSTAAAPATGGHELLDWRTLPVIADELFKGDDVAAENKYDRTIAQVNAQDKKLQLEQSSIEVEYKAVTSEKEAVKKILDTNAASSFKYFS